MLLLLVGIAALLLGLYLYHVNNAMKQVSPEILAVSPHRWTDDEVRKTYDRVSNTPIDFASHIPPLLKRRYIVVGGSGLVGSTIVLQLLQRGQPPSSIRIVDFNKPTRPELLTGVATQVEFVKTDITSASSTDAAFLQPWKNASMASLPLTVFHTAAIIKPQERLPVFLDRSIPVNVVGTSNVLSSSRKANASVLIGTSSASVSLRPTSFWLAPWQRSIPRYTQMYPSPSSETTPVRVPSDYFANYAYTKALAEQTILGAHSPSSNTDKGLRTGIIRPACAVYGSKNDLIFGNTLTKGGVVTWISHIIQNIVHTGNVSLAHLYLERALLSSPTYPGGGKAFVASDPNPPPSFEDTYTVLRLAGCKIDLIPPIVMLILAHLIELYCLALATWPGSLGNVLREPQWPLVALQPSTLFSSSLHQYADDGEARKPVEEGGIGYKSACTSLEGVCSLVREFVVEKEGLGEIGSVERLSGI